MGGLRRRRSTDGSRVRAANGVIAVTDVERSSVGSVDGVMSVALTGPFDTAQLPRVAPDPVTITVARTVAPGREDDYLRWSDEAVAELRRFPGCLGAGVLLPGADGGDHQFVFRFENGVSLRNWEKSPQRAALMETAQEFVVAERITRTVGVENFFELPVRAEPRRSLWKRIVTDVAWVYPVGIGSAVFVSPILGDMPLWSRVVLSTLLITVVMRLVVGPIRSRLRSRRTL